MKFWIEHCLNITVDTDSYVQLGLCYQKHANGNSKFKSWFGRTLYIHFFKWTISFNFVDDYEAYDSKINYWQHKRKATKNEIKPT